MASETPSKIQISATSIQEVDIKDDKKAARKNSATKSKKSSTNVRKKESGDAIATKDESRKSIRPNERKTSKASLSIVKRSASAQDRHKLSATAVDDTKRKKASETALVTSPKSPPETSKKPSKQSKIQITTDKVHRSVGSLANKKMDQSNPTSPQHRRVSATRRNSLAASPDPSALACTSASTSAVPREVLGLVESTDTNRRRSVSASSSRAGMRKGRRRSSGFAEEEVCEEDRHLTLSVIETDARKRSFLSETFSVDEHTMELLKKNPDASDRNPAQVNQPTVSNSSAKQNTQAERGAPSRMHSKSIVARKRSDNAGIGRASSGTSAIKGAGSDTATADPTSAEKKLVAKGSEEPPMHTGVAHERTAGKKTKKGSVGQSKGALHVNSKGHVFGLKELTEKRKLSSRQERKSLTSKTPSKKESEQSGPQERNNVAGRSPNQKESEQRSSLGRTSPKVSRTGSTSQPPEALLVTDPAELIPDTESGLSAGLEHRKIREEWFASTDDYRASIDATKQQLAAALVMTVSPVPDPKDEWTETQVLPPQTQTHANPSGEGESWSSSSPERDSAVNSGRRRSSKRRHGSNNTTQHRRWKRKTSAKAYRDFLRDSDPRYRSDDESTKSGRSMRSSKSGRSSASAYPASSTEALGEHETDLASELSQPQQQLLYLGDEPPCENCVNAATSTTYMRRTEGTQTTAAEFVLLDRRSCLVKVLAALQRLNTDEALQVARILRRSLEDESRCREDKNVYEFSPSQRSVIDASHPPVARTESQKALAADRQPPYEALRDDIPDQGYDEMTRIVSQIDLMVRSKLRITAAPYSLIYETLINYHLEITQDYSPSVAVFNYYLTEHGHPLFDDTSGFARPTILQVARESLLPRLYAHRASQQPRLLPDNARLLQLQLFIDELLICPFCGADVVWGQYEMCVEFCCEPFAELVGTEYEEDLGMIRRQAQLRSKDALLGQLNEPEELIAEAVNSASGMQAPAKISCSLDQMARLESIRAYGQEAKSGQPVPSLPGFTMDMSNKPASAEKQDNKDENAADERATRRKSASERRRTMKQRRRSMAEERRIHSSEPTGVKKKKRRRRTSGSPRTDGGELEDSGEEHAGHGGKRSSGKGSSKKVKPGGRRLSHTPEADAQVKQMEAVLGRKLSPGEIKDIMERVGATAAAAHRLSITVTGISERPDTGSMTDITEKDDATEADVQQQDKADQSTEDDTMVKETDSLEADDELGDVDSTSTHHHGKGRRSHERGRRPGGRKKTRPTMRDDDDSSIYIETGSHRSKTRAKDGRRETHGDDPWERESLSNDQIHYRLSDSAYLESGVTQLPPELAAEQPTRLPESDRPPPPSPPVVTQPADLGDRQFIQEYYPGGELFVTWFDDGSGHVLYPSGEPAVLITQESAGRRFVVLPDGLCLPPPNTDSCVLAMFEPRGVGFVYTEAGHLRLLFDQCEGWYHRNEGGIRRWRWNDLDNHLNHSPVLQPVIFAISKHVAVRVIRQDYILLSFWANQRSARFNVGVTVEWAEVAPPVTARYRLAAPPGEERTLAQLRAKVRHILSDMARLTDEPARYVCSHHPQRDLTYSLCGPPPKWTVAEPRHPSLPGGISPALKRRSARAQALGDSARQAFLLQRMLIGQQLRTGDVVLSSGEERRRRSPSSGVEA